MPQLCLSLLNLSARYEGGVALSEALAAAEKAGVERVGLDTSGIRAWLQQGRSLEELSAELGARGLRCYELIHLECDPADERQTLRRAERTAEWCALLRPAWVLTASLAPAGEPLARLFGRCADLLAESGAGLAYEFFPWAAIDRLARAREVVERAGRANAGVLLDCWHFFYGPDDWKELEDFPLEAIAYVQFTDSIPVAPERYEAESQTSRRLPGDGCFELARFARTLLSRGFDGTVSIEVLSPETRALGAREFARQCVERTRPFFG
jgi:sugar phosphate isomerase/epimerase